MSAGIMKGVDRGYVWGDTWHKMPEYVCLDVPVSNEQCQDVLDYPLEKRQLLRVVNGSQIPAEAWEIVRTDTDTPLAHHVGKDFTVMNNRILFDFIESAVLSEFPDIKVESVGTLWGGKIAFVNLNVGEFCVPGDKSKSVSRLMYYNPLGLGRYKVCAHNVRVVCNNTLRLGTSEAHAKGLLRMVSHTKNAQANIHSAMGEILALREAFLEEQELLARLSKIGVTSKMLEDFYGIWMPIDEDEDSDRKQTRRTNILDGITKQFEADQDLEKSIERSAYALLNAVTYTFDHEDPKRGGDVASVAWDGMVGIRSDKKDAALEALKVVAL